MQLSLFHHARARKEEQKRADIYRALLHYEAKIGGEIFGPVPQGTRREFFCLDERTWVWHEEWTDGHGPLRVMVARLFVRSRPSRILPPHLGLFAPALGWAADPTC